MSPIAHSLELSVNGVRECLQLGVEVLIDYLGAPVVKVSEEDESDVVFKVEFEVGVLTSESLELDDELFDEQRKSELHLEGSLILGWDSNDLVDFDGLLDDLFNGDLHNLGE